MIKLEVSGGNHETLHALVQELLKDKDVTFAAYRQEHQLFDTYTLMVRTAGKSPKTILNRAVMNLSAKLDAFKKQLLKVVK
jgi:DNA-directed RNA polymerase subunit L